MAQICGMVDVAAQPILDPLPSGTVLVHLDDVALRFRSLHQLDAWVDELHRQRADAGGVTT